jgi:SpoVK/Ycf46/Vps4 family AAA+-type ATPase
MIMDVKTRLANYFKASFPCVAIVTTEEVRAQTETIAAARSFKKARGVVTWSATDGMIELSSKEGEPPRQISDTEDLVSACKQRIENAVYIFRDVHTWPWESDPILARAFRDLLQWGPSKGTSVVIIGPEFKPHGTCEKLVTMIDYTLPSPEDLDRIARGVAQSTGKDPEALGLDESVIRALGGLSTPEAENALTLAYVETKRFDPAVIYREKVQAVRKTGLLDIIEADPAGLDGIGGLEQLKAWVRRRERAYSKEARDFGLPLPKGVLIVGVPGTGKSLSAKAFGTALGIPTLKWDIGSAFNSLVGASESRTRDTLALAGAIAPCVLWVDEIDKGLAGSQGSGAGDSGVTRRVFGTLISWMQERKRPVFVVATANQVESLPPELLRKGRFDEIFAVNLPRPDEREAIFRIQLGKKKRDPKAFELRDPVAKTEGFTGSEIETVVDEAMFAAFERGQGDITTVDLIDAARSITPLSVTAAEQVKSIQKWAETRARFASSPEARGQQSADGNLRRLSQE